MNSQLYLKHWFFLILLTATVSCERKKGETVQVNLVLTAHSFNAVSTSTADPTNLDEINCFYVLVGGPEDFMNTMACGQKQPNGELGSAITGGLLVGGVGRSDASSIQIDVPVGNDRHFYLFGTRSVPPLGCRQYGTSFYSLNIKSTTSSNAYLIGKAFNQSLSPGQTKEISLPLELDGANWVDQCLKYGITNGEISGDTDAQASVLYIDKQTFPAINQFRANACEPFHITPKNLFWKTKPLLTDSVVQTRRLLAAGGNESIDTYATAADCSALPAVNGSSSFTVLAGATTTTRWMKIDPAIATTYKLQFAPDTASLVPAYFSASQNAYWSIYPRSPTHKVFSLTGSELVQSEVCYAYKVNLYDLNGTKFAVSTLPYSFSNYSAGGGKRNYSAFADSACTQDITTLKDQTLDTIYVKFHIQQGAGRANVVVQKGINIGFITAYVLGNSTRAGIAVLGARTLVAGTCEGPFQVHITNADGAHLINNTAQSVAATVSSQHTNLHTNSDCSDSATPSKTLNIGSGGSGSYFYMKHTGVLSDSPLTITGTELNSSEFLYSVQSF